MRWLRGAPRYREAESTSLRTGENLTQNERSMIGDIQPSRSLRKLLPAPRAVRSLPVAGRAANRYFSTVIVTRRFCARPTGLSLPSGFLFSAMGTFSPNPSVVMVAPGNPFFFTNQSFTACARSRERTRFSFGCLWNPCSRRSLLCLREMRPRLRPLFPGTLPLRVGSRPCRNQKARHPAD